MNVLPFVMAILFILSYGMSAAWQERLCAHRNEKAYAGLRAAERRILRRVERQQFNELEGTPIVKKREERVGSKPEAPLPTYPINPACARLNLYPLLVGGRDEHPALYETAIKLLKAFYQEGLFGGDVELPHRLLDALILGARSAMEQKIALPLETILLSDHSLQRYYYLCLKGTKRRGYPPLVDYVKIEQATSQICLFHAHPNLLGVFFGADKAVALYNELHAKPEKQGVTLEALCQWVGPQLSFVDPEVWNLIDFKRTEHAPPERQVFVEEWGGISIRKICKT